MWAKFWARLKGNKAKNSCHDSSSQVGKFVPSPIWYNNEKAREPTVLVAPRVKPSKRFESSATSLNLNRSSGVHYKRGDATITGLQAINPGGVPYSKDKLCYQYDKEQLQKDISLRKRKMMIRPSDCEIISTLPAQTATAIMKTFREAAHEKERYSKQEEDEKKKNEKTVNVIKMEHWPPDTKDSSTVNSSVTTQNGRLTEAGQEISTTQGKNSFDDITDELKKTIKHYFKDIVQSKSFKYGSQECCRSSKNSSSLSTRPNKKKLSVNESSYDSSCSCETRSQDEFQNNCSTGNPRAFEVIVNNDGTVSIIEIAAPVVMQSQAAMSSEKISLKSASVLKNGEIQINETSDESESNEPSPKNNMKKTKGERSSLQKHQTSEKPKAIRLTQKQDKKKPKIVPVTTYLDGVPVEESRAVAYLSSSSSSSSTSSSGCFFPYGTMGGMGNMIPMMMPVPMPVPVPYPQVKQPAPPYRTEKEVATQVEPSSNQEAVEDSRETELEKSKLPANCKENINITVTPQEQMTLIQYMRCLRYQFCMNRYYRPNCFQFRRL